MADKMKDAPEFWTSPKVVLKCVGPKLVPFFKTVAIYFVLAIPRENPSWFACLIKCLPVAWLCIFVVMHGMSLGEKHAYSRKVLLGLIFSCLGDAMLIWPCCFIYGMGFFGIAHLLYILAFGMHPSNKAAGTVCFVVTLLGTAMLFPGLDGPYLIVVPFYIALLMFMVWRAVARVQLFNDLWTWTKLCSCGGGILFAISDCVIGVNKFRVAVPYAQGLIMISYYAAQLGIALSVVDNKAMAVLSAAQSNAAGTNGTSTTYCTPMKGEQTSCRGSSSSYQLPQSQNLSNKLTTGGAHNDKGDNNDDDNNSTVRNRKE